MSVKGSPALSDSRQTSTAEVKRSVEFGTRLKAFRSARKLSLRQLGSMTGITASFLSQLERGLCGTTTSTLMQITNALGISVSDLFDEKQSAPHAVIAKTDRPALAMVGGYRKTLISRRPIRDVEVYSGEFDVGGSTGEKLYTHGDAHEVLIVLKGRIALTLAGERFTLHEGDSIEYATSTPHGIANTGATPAEVLWIIAPPTSGAADLDQYLTFQKPVTASVNSNQGL